MAEFQSILFSCFYKFSPHMLGLILKLLVWTLDCTCFVYGIS